MNEGCPTSLIAGRHPGHRGAEFPAVSSRPQTGSISLAGPVPGCRRIGRTSSSYRLSASESTFHTYQLMTQLLSSARDISMWLILLSLFGMAQERRWRRATGMDHRHLPCRPGHRHNHHLLLGEGRRAALDRWNHDRRLLHDPFICLRHHRFRTDRAEIGFRSGL